MNRFRISALSRARSSERGVTILLVAVAMLFMVIAIAAIAIDVGAMYTARGEAKHAADAAALAGAKVLADSGITSDPTNVALQGAATTLATQIATSVATQNKVGGRTLTSAEVTVSFPNGGDASFASTPQVSVTVQRTDLPTFFAKAWGRSTVAVGATSAAEAVNPSNPLNSGGTSMPLAIAPRCIKPWIIPNLDPNNTPSKFFDLVSGQIISPGQVGQKLTLSPFCPPLNRCPVLPTTLTPGIVGGNIQYVRASLTDPPANQEPAACAPSCNYEESIVGCSPQTITCGVAGNASAEFTKTCANYKTSTNNATSCLIHSSLGQDTIEVAGSPPSPPLSQPMQFIAGNGNPLVVAGKASADTQVTSSDSLVTIPVYDNTLTFSSSSPANIIGFIQGFVVGAGPSSGLPSGQIQVVIVNMSGCGTGATGTPLVGSGLSPVPVHLITP